MTRVAVIGAGSIGANIAYRLAARGAEVTVVDAGKPGNGTSAASISWLSTFPQIAGSVPAMVAHRRRTNDGFRRLAGEIGDGWIHWTGTLTWADLPRTAARLRQDFAAMTAMGEPLRELDADAVRAAEPALDPPPDTPVYLEEDGGWVDAPAMVAALLRGAGRHGATVLQDAPVLAVKADGDRHVVRTPEGEVTADVVVNAAGSWASHVGALAGAPVPLDLRPGLVVWSRPLATPIGRVINSTTLNIRPDPDGGVAVHWRGEDTYTAHGYNAETPAQVIEAAAEVIPELRGTAPARSAVGVRPVPPGGPVVGWHPSRPGLYVAVSHGGIGWGPTWGDLAAAAILDGDTSPAAEAFTPRRFFR
ncbi:FAD-dependent oxidoreductase [Nonomuraea phyllanthi]|uniref:NAD(P)/FAD-dependent oxidoreductase n=1 Tax=Nonomuraea phyllanthi TaxID=2219224 RepID=UPI00129328F0|nr:FAD-dependent oxidoreductase [Nonomuraea phyllanthi]QFY11471.1 FAD-dependent oxidoreductase [Nonomuraea phyllanthi]